MKLFIQFKSESRSIVNPDVIKNYIMELAEEQPEGVKTWVTSRLKNWIQNKSPDVRTLHKAPADSPAWVKDALDKGQEVYSVVITPKFKQNITHALAYLRGHQGDILRVSIEDAIKKGEEYIQQVNKKAALDEKEGTDVETLYAFPDKCRVVNILTQQGLAREGKIMEHCSGDERQNYIARIKSGAIQVWSFRDAKNTPHATIEYRIKEKQIAQIKGHSNGGVKAQYVTYLQKFFKLPEIKKKVDNFDEVDLININILAIEGTWYDLLHLPENLVINTSLILQDLKVKTLPKGLQVKNVLNINNTQIKELPAGLVVGDLDARLTLLKRLPEDIKIRNDLYLQFSEIEQLPENLHINGDLTLANTPITKLPKNLNVRDLNLRNTKITELSEGLVIRDFILNKYIKRIPKRTIIKGTLECSISTDLTIDSGVVIHGSLFAPKINTLVLKGTIVVKEDCKINDIGSLTMPRILRVGKILDLSGSRTETLKGMVKLSVEGSMIASFSAIDMLPKDTKILGSLYAENSELVELPEGIRVGEEITLSGSKITKLPDNLVVNGNLDISYTEITALPDNLTVHGMLNASHTPIQHVGKNLKVDGLAHLVQTKIKELPADAKVGRLKI